MRGARDLAKGPSAATMLSDIMWIGKNGMAKGVISRMEVPIWMIESSVISYDSLETMSLRTLNELGKVLMISVGT